MNVPLVLTVHIKSNFFVPIFKVGLKSIADALFIRISILLNFYWIFSTAFIIYYYFLKSQQIAITLPHPPIDYTYF